MAEGINLGKAYVQIMPSAKGIKGKLTSALGGEVGAAGEGAGTSLGAQLASKAKIAFAAAAIGKFVMSSIKEGAKLEQSLGGIETLYKSSANKMKQYAAEAYKTTGLSANAYMENVTGFSAAMIRSLGGDTKKAAKLSNMAMKDMSDNANKMGTDMSSITQTYQSLARGNYAMLDNLKLGYGGTKQELQRLLQDAEKLTGIKYDINNFADVTQAIHAVQKEMGITGTTAREAQHTISGSINMMKASWKDFLGNLALGKDMTQPIKNLAMSAIAVLRNVVPAIGRVLIGIPKAIVANGPQLYAAIKKSLEAGIRWIDSGGLAKMMDAGAKMIVKMAKSFLKNAPAVISGIADLFSKGGEGIGKAFPVVASKVGQFIGKLAVEIVKHLPQIALAIVKAIPKIAGAVYDVIKGIVKGIFSLIGGVLGEAFAPVKAAVGNAINYVKAVISSGVESIKAVWSGIKAIASIVREAFGAIPSIIGSLIGGAVSIVRNAIGGIRSAFQSVSAFAGMVRGAFNAVKNAITHPIQTAQNIVSGIISKIRGLFPLRIGKILNIKLPHLSVTGGKAPYGIGGAGSLPKFDVKWYAKGAILTQPTIFGMNAGNFLGGGEAGPEGIIPLDRFWRQMDQMTRRVESAATNGYNAELKQAIVEGIDAAMATWIPPMQEGMRSAMAEVGFFVDSRQLAVATSDAVEKRLDTLAFRAKRKGGKL